jgi:ABC-type transporter lipoprotein component MlaA
MKAAKMTGCGVQKNSNQTELHAYYRKNAMKDPIEKNCRRIWYLNGAHSGRAVVSRVAHFDSGLVTEA